MVSPQRSNVVMILLMTFLMISACASKHSVSGLSASQKARMARILVFESEGLPNGSYTVVGRVESVACQEGFEERSEITKLKVQAAKLGADAVINLKFRKKNKMDWVHDCWSTVVGAGDAVRITNTGAAAPKVGMKK